MPGLAHAMIDVQLATKRLNHITLTIWLIKHKFGRAALAQINVKKLTWESQPDGKQVISTCTREHSRKPDEPIKVNVKNPLVSLVDGTATNVLNMRFQLDKDLFRVAKNAGHDAIAIVTSKRYETIKTGKLPRSVELNVFDIRNTSFERLQKD